MVPLLHRNLAASTFSGSTHHSLLTGDPSNSSSLLLNRPRQSGNNKRSRMLSSGNVIKHGSISLRNQPKSETNKPRQTKFDSVEEKSAKYLLLESRNCPSLQENRGVEGNQQHCQPRVSSVCEWSET